MNIKGSDGLLRERNEIKYSFIAQRKKAYPVATMCLVLGVNCRSYYSYMQRKKDQPNDPYHQELQEVVRDIVKASDDTYGSRRMKRH